MALLDLFDHAIPPRIYDRQPRSSGNRLCAVLPSKSPLVRKSGAHPTTALSPRETCLSDDGHEGALKYCVTGQIR